jgi:outer membrane receptor protein involved in Fe transport
VPDFGTADWYGGEVKVGATLVDRARVRDQLYVGLQADWISTRSRSFESTLEDDAGPAPGIGAVDIRQSALSAGGYLQNELEIAQTVNLVAGLRYDYNSAFIGNTSPSQALSPRGALIVRTRTDSTFKLIYSQGFRNPSVYEAFFTDATDILDNKKLSPETIRNVELAYEYRMKKVLKLGLSTCYFRASDLLRQQSVCYDAASGEVSPLEGGTCGAQVLEQFQNVAQVDGLGSELTVVGNLSSGFQARGTVAVQKATQKQGNADQALTNSPVIVSNLMASYPLVKDRTFLSAQLHHVGARDAGLDPAGNLVGVSQYLLANLMFSARDLVKGLDLTAGVYNALDQRYRDVAVSEKIVVDRSDVPVLALPADGRTFAFRLTCRY